MSTHLDAFGSFVGTHFDPAVGASITRLTAPLNDLTGAIEMHAADPREFADFQAHLKGRLVRLRGTVARHPAIAPHVGGRLRDLAGRSWQGAWAELSAIDVVGADASALAVEVPINTTLGIRHGVRASYLLDGLVGGDPEFGLPFEVKIWRSRIETQLRRIGDAVIKRDGKPIMPNYDRSLATPHLDQSLVNEIADAIVSAQQSGGATLRHAELPGVDFRWPGGGVRISEHSYDAYRRAQESELLVLEKAEQLRDDGANLRVYVTHPWIDLESTSYFSQPKTLFRSLARRVFCRLTRDLRPIENVLPASALAGKGVTVADVAMRLGGLMFVVDQPSDASGPTSRTDRYLYLNPNVRRENSIDIQWEHYVDRRLTDFDDFAHDNY